jgi:hypothetical protein
VLPGGSLGLVGCKDEFWRPVIHSATVR